MEINPHIFRAYDIRGIYPKEINEGLFKLIGFVLGKKHKRFLVGYDIRKSSPKLARALISGLVTSGAKVFFCKRVSFGLCFFSGSKLKVDRSLFVTASHLPHQWNGLKINFGDGTPTPSKESEKIRDEISKIDERKIKFKKPKYQRVNFKKEYIKAILEKFPILKNNNLKAVLDCGNGATSLVAPEIFKKFGFRVIELFCKPDPNFPNRSPEPNFEATKILREKVLKEKADFGVAFDGDGDRGVIIDDKGRYLSGNQIGIIFGKEILKESKKAKIVKTIACSMAFEEELKTEIFEVPVGHTFVVSGCKKYKASLGVEESGHIVMPKYFLFDDAILIPLKVAEIILKEKKKLSQIVDEIKIYPFEEIAFECPDQIKFEVVEKLKKDFQKRFKRVNTLDGVKVYFESGWILIRASNTSPKIRLYLEAKNEKILKKLKEKFSYLITRRIQKS